MDTEAPKNLKNKIQELEYEYWFDQREFGKVMIVASLALLVVSVHALFTINGAVQQASNSTERLETTAGLVGSDGFQQSMESLAATGATIQGQGIEQVIADLEYASSSVEGVQNLSIELENAQTTYQWTTLIGILGLVTGITVIYI
ncbi:hypothetical protein [Candidatus Nanohalobium constans]|uniref:Uncharacterized protein n=1 Tax=Candidatus Nanohalobium constans TaxID=2565781 RepID=A0A5Q0UEZ4_9ARCH|nr:hypothetical protein [Candidatus Nanohalobium constans]QGA80116.1 hypothetical protein LC1Nh_0212 [Candidatus Nanohalobium constans]